MDISLTGGGKPDYIPHDDILDKVTGLLGSTCTGFEVPFGGDGVGTSEIVINDGVSSPVQNIASDVLLEFTPEPEHYTLPICEAKSRKVDESTKPRRLYGMTTISKELETSKVIAQEEEEPFLKIVANPTIVYNVGETKAIFCNSSIQPIEWFSPSNKKIERRSNTNNRVYVEKLSPRGGVPLIIHYIKISDAGNWTCKAGELSASIDMIVGEKVKIAERNVDLVGDEGHSVRLTCEANGYPTPVVVWYKGNNVPIHSDGKKYVIKADNSLEIKKLSHLDVGDYVCKVRQKALFHYTDKTVHLAVQHKPILYNSNTQAPYTAKYKTEEVYAILNETKNITCSAIANPQPTYHWYRRHDGYDDDEITDPETVIHSEDGTNSVLVLRMHNESYLGEFKCAATNSKGSESIIFHVSLGTRPDPPDFVSLALANVTEFVFNVSCSTCPIITDEDISPNPENLTITGYEFQLVPAKKDYAPDWDAATQIAVNIENENDTLFNVGPLNNNTAYHVRVRTVNAAGYSEWFEVSETFKTTANAFKLAATTLLIIIALIFTRCY